MSAELRRRVAKMVWIQLGKATNPYFAQAASGCADQRICDRWVGWNQAHMFLMRKLFRVVFEGADLTDELLTQALDFVDGIGI